MNVPLVKLTLIIGVYTLVLFSALVWRFANAQPVWDWGIQVIATLIGTGLGVASGIWLTGKAKENDLSGALAGETQSCLGILQEGRITTVIGSDKKELGKATLVPLPMVVAEEAVRSGVFDAEDTLLLSKLVSHLRIHNNEVFFILSARVGLGQDQSLLYMITELKTRQREISKFATELMRVLVAQGIKAPKNLANQDAGQEGAGGDAS